MLTLNDGRAELWQWDTGRTLDVDADCSQVHFSNKVFGRSIDVDVTDGVAIIPDILLQTDKDLNVWAFVGTAENGYTKISKTFRVNRRNKPADYVFTPVEQTTIAEIYAIAQSVRDDADAGLFDGKPGEDGRDGVDGKDGAPGRDGVDGKDGAPGKDGISATHQWNGTVLTVTSASGTSSSDLKGDKGDKGNTGPAGKDGAPGADGKTPEYGVDYGTPEQIAGIAQQAAGILQPDVNQIKQDVAAITPDDTTVDGKPWTSKKIVDSLCMPIEESGNPVQCYPVENYPLGVRVSWEPVQEGSGDPSPDNIRPITGRDAVSVTRCGKNLLKPTGINGNSSGIVFTANDDGTVTINGTATGTAYYNYSKKDSSKYLPEGDYVLIPGNNLTRITVLNVSTNTGYASSVGENRIVHITAGKYLIYIAVNTGITADNVIARPQIVLGTTATPYEPYTGSTTDIALPETVYGGTLDVEIGVVTVEYGHIASYAGEPLPGEWISDRDTYAPDATPTTGAQVAYKLAQPYTIQLPPKQIAALSGVNTLYTDADGVVVTGAEDPKHTITELKNAIISLGGNI